MRAAVYGRVSTTRQAQAQTIEQQLDRLRAAVAGHGWELDEQHVYRDDGRGWTGCGTMRHWPSWTWSWSPRRTGWPATTSTRCC
jgi:DNA invertase Pin-like site-specific DNA recombinase